MNILLGDKIIAANFTPALPPPRGILADWLRASGSRWSWGRAREERKRSERKEGIE